jgi:hypothetical protein
MQAEICALSAPARDRSRTTIYGSDMTHFYGVSCDCSIVCFIDLRLLADNVAQLSTARGSDPPLSL